MTTEDPEPILWPFKKQNGGQASQYLACECSNLATVGECNDGDALTGWQHGASRRKIRYKRRFPNQASVRIGTDEHRKTFISWSDQPRGEDWLRAHAENHVIAQVEGGKELDLGSFLTASSKDALASYSGRVQMLVARLADLPDVQAAVSYYTAVGRLFGNGGKLPAAALEELSRCAEPYAGQIIPVETEQAGTKGVLILEDRDSAAMWSARLHLTHPVNGTIAGHVLRRTACSSFDGQSWEHSVDVARWWSSSGNQNSERGTVHVSPLKSFWRRWRTRDA